MLLSKSHRPTLIGDRGSTLRCYSSHTTGHTGPYHDGPSGPNLGSKRRADERSVIRRQPALGRRNALRFSALRGYCANLAAAGAYSRRKGWSNWAIIYWNRRLWRS